MRGGEESGGYAFRGNVPRADGIGLVCYMLIHGKDKKGTIRVC